MIYHGGLPFWNVVGLPDTGVKESRDRIKTAIKNSGFELPNKKYIINLSPADIRKEGTGLDLSIAIAILRGIGQIRRFEHNDVMFVGELSLNGNLNKISGALPICLEASKEGIKKIILPKENANEACLVEGIEVIGISSLKEAVDYLNGTIQIKETKNNIADCFETSIKYKEDFSDVKGQESIKRALEVAASGGHSCILVGCPGSGKTLLSRRIPTILPKLTFNEALEITKIYSVAGLIEDGSIINERPFRAPHHTITKSALIGGGKFPKPGEISLAQYGVLFLDEFPEFSKQTIEVLRGPLEDKKVTISRVCGAYSYPCNFMLVASMNPCPCGYFGSNAKLCTCTEKQRVNYFNKISGPILDRIDIQVEVPSVKYEELGERSRETSDEIRQRVNEARNIQLKRYKGLNIYSNSELTPKMIEKVCKLNEPSKLILKKYFERLNLSTRAYYKILKIARTIADLDAAKDIETMHIIEAIQYRSLDKSKWK